MSKPFQFKEFCIEQDRCAMKIGTDGVLLGAWTTPHNASSILDIGTGTGLIALMLAQKSASENIDALEIEGDAYEQAVENFENSPWADRLFCYHASLLEFAKEIDEQYDLIVSNPPFYEDAYHSTDSKRNQARFASSLPFEHLFACVAKLLAPEGNFSMIAPFKEEENLLHIAKKHKLYPNHLCRVQGNQKSDIKRSLFKFSFQETAVRFEHLTLEIERHKRTSAYEKLVEDYYL